MAVLTVALSAGASLRPKPTLALVCAVEQKGWPPDKPVYHIDLPYEEPYVPPGPNHQQFTALCRLCHSPRLALNQPLLTEKKWGEVVHKMVAVYGAPLTPTQERDVVAYLTAVHGRKP
jgi:hypothetical protein